MKLRTLVYALTGVALRLVAHGAADLSDLLEVERLEQSGTVISIVFDDSGSMEGNKMAQAKTAFRQWIAAVPPTYRLGLTALNAGPLIPLGRDNRPALLSAVNRITAAQGTPLAATIRSTVKTIEERRRQVGPYERHILLVFTDGEDTTAEKTPGVQRELARAATAGIETVGIGFHGEGTYMRAAATRYYDASNLAELQNCLAKVDAEIGDTSDVLIDDRTRASMEASAPLGSTSAAAPATVAIPSQKPDRPNRSRHSSIPYVVVFSSPSYGRGGVLGKPRNTSFHNVDKRK